MFKKGDEGLKVQRIKQRLLDLGYMESYEDAKFDAEVDRCVREFQRLNNLKEDGIVGDKTLAVLFPELQPNPATSSSLLSPAGEKLIIDFEVGGGEAYYSKFLSRPSYPGYDSGVTIGCGWDCGYNKRANLDSDWAILPQDTRNRLAVTLGKTKNEAKAILPMVKDIVIPWNVAYNVFINVTVPKWFATTAKTYPGLYNLPKDAQAALVSLVFNRGGLIDNSDRRKEMKAIRDHVATGNLKAIASEIRKMKRLWIGTDVEAGLIKRREAEAKLVENA